MIGFSIDLRAYLSYWDVPKDKGTAGVSGSGSWTKHKLRVSRDHDVFNFRKFVSSSETMMDGTAVWLFHGSAQVMDMPHGEKRIELLWKLGDYKIHPIVLRICSRFPGVDTDKMSVFFKDIKLGKMNEMLSGDFDCRLCSSNLHSHLTFKIDASKLRLSDNGALNRDVQKDVIKTGNGYREDISAYINFKIMGTAPALSSFEKACQNQISDMKNCLKNIPCDYRVNGTPCHKFMLKARSEVFGRMLESGMLEENKSEVTIMTSSGRELSAEAAGILVNFLYCSETERLESGNMSLLNELAQVAHQYKIQSLLEATIRALHLNSFKPEFLKPDLLLELFNFALNADLEYLKLTLVDMFIKAKSNDLKIMDECLEIDVVVASLLLREIVRNPKLEFCAEKSTPEVDDELDSWIEYFEALGK